MEQIMVLFGYDPWHAHCIAPLLTAILGALIIYLIIHWIES